MFNKQEFEERIRLQEEKVKAYELNCQEAFELLGRHFFDLENRPVIGELDAILQVAEQKKGDLEAESAILNDLKTEYIDEQKNSCSHCGARIMVEGSKFCYNCGIPISAGGDDSAEGQPKAEKISDQTNCPECFSQLKPGARFCGKCGKQID